MAAFRESSRKCVADRRGVSCSSDQQQRAPAATPVGPLQFDLRGRPIILTLSDGAQSLKLEEFARLMEGLRLPIRGVEFPGKATWRDKTERLNGDSVYSV